jgi:hypothetical protein
VSELPHVLRNQQLSGGEVNFPTENVHPLHQDFSLQSALQWHISAAGTSPSVGTTPALFTLSPHWVNALSSLIHISQVEYTPCSSMHEDEAWHQWAPSESWESQYSHDMHAELLVHFAPQSARLKALSAKISLRPLHPNFGYFM